MRCKLGMLCMVVAAALATPAWAAIDVYLAPVDSYTTVGGTVAVDILADIPVGEPIVGWGLDLSVDLPVGHVVAGSVVIGPLFDAVPTADGDDLAGYVHLDSLSGNGVLLATVTLMGDVLGDTPLTLGDNNAFPHVAPPADLTEGFGLDPTGFADVNYTGGVLHVIPEPATFALLVLGGLAVARRR